MTQEQELQIWQQIFDETEKTAKGPQLTFYRCIDYINEAGRAITGYLYRYDV